VSSEPSDEELLAGMGARDLGALDSLYARYGGAAFSLAYRITLNRETAEEVVQEAFFAAWRGAATFRPDRGTARSWLLGIIHHRAIDFVRGRKARGQTVPLDEQLPIAGKDDLWASVQQILDGEEIRRALATLPAEQRESIELAYFGGLTYPEIASRLGVPLGTIKSRLRLGLEKLRARLLEIGAPEPEAR
jgi:RNA polymerase sigma-70 factor (ECF subfamily)